MALKKITAKENQRDKTYTIRTYENNKLTAKYRTIPMSIEEFESSKYNTENDWRQFLKTDEYYPVKK